MIGRVADTITGWGRQGGYFATDEEGEFADSEEREGEHATDGDAPKEDVACKGTAADGEVTFVADIEGRGGGCRDARGDFAGHEGVFAVAGGGLRDRQRGKVDDRGAATDGADEFGLGGGECGLIDRGILGGGKQRGGEDLGRALGGGVERGEALAVGKNERSAGRKRGTEESRKGGEHEIGVGEAFA
jgi:hypothetical protein